MKSAEKARSNGLYRHIRTSKEIIRNLLNDFTNDIIAGTFSFIIGKEPTYQVIKNGEWHYDRPYGTIHRLASGGIIRGISRACFEYCLHQMDYIRIDTHKDNISMQAAIEKFGFKRCGNVYMLNGTERIAYDYLRL